MSQYLAIRNGGKTDEQGALRFLEQLSSNGAGPLTSGGMQVTTHATPNNSIDIQVGDLIITYQSYCYHTWNDAIYNVTIGNNSSGNPRIDSIVAYVDLSVVSSSSSNNPGALKFLAVQGTPAGSPTAPSGSTIQSGVGAGNPYYVLGNVNVPNGFTSGSQITNSGSTVIVDTRTKFLLAPNNRAFGFSIPGTASVGNDQSWNPISPEGMTAVKLWIYTKTAPTGSSLTVEVYDITQSRVVASVTLGAGNQSASTTSMTNAAITAGDVLRVDTTGVGSSVPGADITAMLECTQP